MTIWAEYLVRVLMMAVFLCGSAYCSGTETAFFSLSKRQVKKLRDSGYRLGHLVADLLLKPGDLLGALLLGNLIVNTLFFATSVSIEDVAEELFGPLQFSESVEPIESLGNGRYRLSASLPIHDWIKAFGPRPA